MTSNPTTRSSRDRGRALVDLLLVFAPIVLFGLLGLRLSGTDAFLGGAVINVGYLFAIAVGWRRLKLRGSGWRELGLKRPARPLRTALAGFGAMLGAAFIWIVVQNIAAALAGSGPAAVDESRFNTLQGNLPLFLLMLLLAWTVIAFGEEMVYRAFTTTRLVEIFGSAGLGKTAAVVGSSLLFGLAHYPAEGTIGILSNGAFGLLFAWIYLRSGRNLWITIIAHALLNTVRFALLFTGAA